MLNFWWREHAGVRVRKYPRCCVLTFRCFTKRRHWYLSPTITPPRRAQRDGGIGSCPDCQRILGWQSGELLIRPLLFLWASPLPSPGLRIPTYRWILIPLVSSSPAQTERCSSRESAKKLILECRYTARIPLKRQTEMEWMQDSLYLSPSPCQAAEGRGSSHVAPEAVREPVGGCT